MKSMRAVLLQEFGAVENFRLSEVMVPPVKEGAVLVRIKAVSFNPIDYQIRQGMSESKLLHSPILGREFAGVVVEGSYMEHGFRQGDDVYAYVGSLASNGTYAEYISVPAGLLARKPAGLSFEEAAAIPLAGLTALQCVDRLNISRGDAVFISGGGGGVGSWIIRLLRSQGIERIYATAGNEQTKMALRGMGLSAGQVLDYREPDFVQQALKGNAGRFDYCIDLVGGAMSEACAALLKVHGSYADVTFQGTGAARELLFDKGATVYHISNYAAGLEQESASIAQYGLNLRRLTDLIERRVISPPDISVVGPLQADTVQRAHRIMELNQSKGRKLIMNVP